SKMIAQVQKEARISSTITALTMRSACRNRPQIVRSWAGTDPARAAASIGTDGAASIGLPASSWACIASNLLLRLIVSFEGRSDRGRQPGGAPRLGDAGEADTDPHQFGSVARHHLLGVDRCAPEIEDARLHLQEVVEAGGPQIVHLAAS